MIKKLRRKFILIAMCSVTAVLMLIVGAINIASYSRINRNADALLTLIAENGGVFPHIIEHHETQNTFFFAQEISPEAPFDTRYFTVVTGSDHRILSVDIGRIAAVSADTAREYAADLLQSGKTQGYYEGYKYRIVPSGSREMVIFLDYSREMSAFFSFMRASFVVSVIGLLLVFVLVVFFSKIAVKPVAESYEKQKRFITDAGHEIKTPLTVIDAGAEVLEMENGENEWTRSIKNQVKKLTALTEKLVFLSRMEEENASLDMTDFSLSDAVRESADSFAAVAVTRGKELICHNKDNIFCHGNKAAIQQLLSILLDNAMKYSSDGGKIEIFMKPSGKYREIRVVNEVDSIAKGNHGEFFERFYREEGSRNARTGGHGIGLSLAQAIVTAHKGKISAYSDDGKTVTLLVLLSANPA